MTSPENIETRLLLEAIYQKYGYDFRDYAQAHIKRRLLRRIALSQLDNISDMQHRLLHDEAFFKVLLADLTIHTTEMFRDPTFYQALRTHVIPMLRTYPSLKVWHAGCSTGQEIYSTAIVLAEEGLYDRTLIYATDVDEMVLEKAKAAIFPAEDMKEYTANYQKGGGLCSFSDYYSAGYGSVVMEAALRKNIVFAAHNLATDDVFGEMHAIICRNVLIYFNRTLQERVIGIFRKSLCRRGFLCLGSKETLQFSRYADEFERVDEKQRIYRRKT